MARGAEYSGTGSLFEVLARIPHRLDELRELLSRLPLTGLVDSAARHGVSAWVADALGAAGHALPEQQKLLTDARSTIASAHKIRRLTIAVFDALAAVGITPIAMKGSVLAARIYPTNPLCRPSSDVDVLVLPEELDRVATQLASLSLHRQVDDSLGDVFEDHHHLSFAGPAGLVEVHFRLISTFGRGLFDDAAIRTRSVPHVFNNRPIRILSPEDEFLYLATHAANHAYLRISWLVDLQQFMRLHPQLDFEAIAARAKDAGFAQALTVSLALLEQLLAVELPAAARKTLPPRRRRFIDQQLFSGARLESAALSTHRLASFALRLWLVDTPGSAVRHVVDGARRYARRVLANR